MILYVGQPQGIYDTMCWLNKGHWWYYKLWWRQVLYMVACPSHAGSERLSLFPREIVLRFDILGSDQGRGQALFLVISLIDLEILIWLSFKIMQRWQRCSAVAAVQHGWVLSANLDNGEKKSYSHGDERTFSIFWAYEIAQDLSRVCHQAWAPDMRPTKSTKITDSL